jgi:hypothetical protein
LKRLDHFLFLALSNISVPSLSAAYFLAFFPPPKLNVSADRPLMRATDCASGLL